MRKLETPACSMQPGEGQQERLKPHLARALANAELYCMALSNLYGDSHYHNLNHWGVVQVSGHTYNVTLCPSFFTRSQNSFLRQFN